MEATLQAFIKALNNFLKHTEYKQFKISNKQIVYLLENKSVVSVLIKKDLNKNHIIVEEVFDTDAEKSELEYFCKKYYAEWVTFFRFDDYHKDSQLLRLADSWLSLVSLSSHTHT